MFRIFNKGSIIEKSGKGGITMRTIRQIAGSILICITAATMAAAPAFAASYVSNANGAAVYYDDGSYVEYNARGSAIYFYDQWGDLVDEKYSQLTEAQFKKQYYTNSSKSSSKSSSSSKYAGASVYDAYWGNSSSHLIAHWEADYQSHGKYTVTLYRDNHKVTSKTSKGGKSVDFTDTIANHNKTGYYYFTVKGSWSGHTDTCTSDDTYVDSSALSKIKSSSSGSSGSASGPGGNPGTVSGPAGNIGWQNYGSTWKYMKPTGQYATNSWELINGKWYYFDGNGTMAANQWVQTDAWYYVGPNGDMLANQWIQSKTNSHIWYYVGGDGRMVTNSVINGWPINANGECYY